MLLMSARKYSCVKCHLLFLPRINCRLKRRLWSSRITFRFVHHFCVLRVAPVQLLQASRWRMVVKGNKNINEAGLMVFFCDKHISADSKSFTGRVQSTKDSEM
ncbi:hypothetical protein BaRGS_00020147 [Batillaria attramentaria]|uniref:Uncharacterized protein n=1 Tax=Batillaria attramentaria TaxID=370345 RepID=A0ABD0KP04_9CAEN